MRSYRLNDVDDLADLITFAEAWASLGDAVAGQVRAILDDPALWHEQNANALRLAQERIGGFHEEIDEALEVALTKFADPDARAAVEREAEEQAERLFGGAR